MNKIDVTRFSQPQGVVEIDWSNPITRGLYAVNLPTPTGVRELISGSAPSFSTNAKIGVGDKGVGLEQVTDGTLTNGVYIPKRVLTSRTEVIVALYPTLASYGAYLASTVNATADSIGNAIYNYRINWVIHGSGWNSYVNVFEGDAPFSLFGKNICMVTRWGANENNGLGKVIVNGVVVTNVLGVGFTGSCDRTQTTAQTVFGINQGSGSRLYLHASFDRYLNDVEALSISQNPWQIFKPIQKQIFVPQPITQEPYKVGDALTMANYRKAMQKVWTSQPQQAVGIDWSNPITRGLVFCGENFGSGFFDAVKSKQSTKSPAASSVATKSGLAVAMSGSQTNGSISFGAVNPLSGSTSATLIICLSTDNTASTTAKLFAGWGAGVNAILVVQTGSGQLGFIFGDASSNRSGASATVFAANNEIATAAFRWSAPNTKAIFVNGNQVSSSNFVDSGVVSSLSGTPTHLQFGIAGDGDPFAGKVQYCRLFNRALSDVEIKSLSQNPWQIFQPLQNKAPITLPQYKVVTPELLADLIINMTTQSAAASGIPAAISYDQLINMLAANALAQNPGLSLDTQINALVAQAQASGIQLNLIASAVLSMSAANALATGIRTNLDKLINIQQGNAVASGGNILLDRAIQTVLSSATALGINSNIDKTININRANAQANGVTTLIDIVTNLVSGNATANSYGFGSGTVLNLQSITSLASGISTKLDRSINQNAANSSASGVKLSLDRAINTLIANAQASGIKTNIDKSILTNTANAIGIGIQTILQYATSIVMNVGPASASGTTLKIDKNILLAAGIANAANVNMSVVFTPLTYDPAYIIFETTEGLVVLDVNKAEVSLVGTQTLISVSSESRTSVFDSTIRPHTFDRN